MKKTVLFLSLFIILFSCNHNTEIKKNHAIVKDSIVQKEDAIAEKKLDTTSKKNNELEKIKVDDGEIVMLPNNRYAVITFDYIEDKKEEDPTKKWTDVPKSVKVFDRITKNHVPETRLDNYYADDHAADYNDRIYYGDFNFDGKMDVAVRGKESGYRNFCYWNFYLATSKGYKFSKSFSEIMDFPIAYFELDAKHKKIIAYREAEFNGRFEYKVQKNKAQLVKDVRSSRLVFQPFNYHSEGYWNGKKMIYTRGAIFNKDFIENDYEKAFWSFKIKNKKEKVVIFDDELSNLYYSVVKNDSLIDYMYSEKFKYNAKNNTLEFTDKNKIYKVFETNDNIGVEIKSKGKTIKLIGDIKSKKGNLSRTIYLKRNEEDNSNSNFENVVIEK